MLNNDAIELKVPCKAEYISLVRLTTSGIAMDANMTVEDLDDLKVCVGEACVNVINLSENEYIEITFNLIDDKMNIFIKDCIEDIPEDLDLGEEAKLGLLIIRSLMDEVEFTDSGIKITKYIE